MLKRLFFLAVALPLSSTVLLDTALAASPPTASSPEGAAVDAGPPRTPQVSPNPETPLMPETPVIPTWKNKICEDPRTEVKCGTQLNNSNTLLQVVCLDFAQINKNSDPIVQSWIRNDRYIPFFDGGTQAPLNWWTITDESDYTNIQRGGWWTHFNYWFNEQTREQGQRYDISVAANAEDTTIRPHVQNCLWKPTANWENPLICGCGRYAESGCFPPGVKILLADGSQKNIEDLAAGDSVWNPIRERAIRVKRIIEGPEELPLIEVAYNGGAVKVSQQHPVLVAKRGDSLKRVSLSSSVDGATDFEAVKAEALEIGHIIQGSDGLPHAITSLRRLPVDEGQIVINFELDTLSLDPKDRAIVSDGVVTGDFTLQLMLANGSTEHQSL